jgi:hypothetical protein
MSAPRTANTNSPRRHHCGVEVAPHREEYLTAFYAQRRSGDQTSKSRGDASQRPPAWHDRKEVEHDECYQQGVATS